MKVAALSAKLSDAGPHESFTFAFTFWVTQNSTHILCDDSQSERTLWIEMNPSKVLCVLARGLLQASLLLQLPLQHLHLPISRTDR